MASRELRQGVYRLDLLPQPFTYPNCYLSQPRPEVVVVAPTDCVEDTRITH
jgi:hypothetical protein